MECNTAKMNIEPGRMKASFDDKIEKEIPILISKQSEIVSIIHNKLLILRSRLEPVIISKPCTVDEKKPDSKTEMGNLLTENNYGLKNSLEIIMEMVNCIQI